MLVIWGPRSYLPDPLRWAQEIQRSLGELGLEVIVQATSDAFDYQRQIRLNEYDLVLGGWNADTNDPADFLEALLDSSQVPVAGDNRASGCNFGRWASRRTDAALEQFRRDRTAEHEAAIFDTIRDDPPFLALAYGPTVIVHGWELQGVHTVNNTYLEISLADLSFRQGPS